MTTIKELKKEIEEKRNESIEGDLEGWTPYEILDWVKEKLQGLQPDYYGIKVNGIIINTFTKKFDRDHFINTTYIKNDEWINHNRKIEEIRLLELPE
jgi:hypothetical protein